MTGIKKIEGIGEAFTKKLEAAGIFTIEKLLQNGATPKGRKEIAEKASIEGNLILEWVNHADLCRIKGVAGQYADLLEESGVDTVVELSKRVPQNLLAKMTEVNADKKYVRRLPVLSQVESWVEQAKKLPA